MILGDIEIITIIVTFLFLIPLLWNFYKNRIVEKFTFIELIKSFNESLKIQGIIAIIWIPFSWIWNKFDLVFDYLIAESGYTYIIIGIFMYLPSLAFLNLVKLILEARANKNIKLKTNRMINELSKNEFEKTFSNKMIDVTKTAEPIVDIWEYSKVLANQKLIPSIVYEKELVELVYRNIENTFDHILLPTSENNMFIIIVVNIIEKKIEGHYKLNIENRYGLK